MECCSVVSDIADLTLDNSSRLFHYSENSSNIRTVASAEWPTDSVSCGPGAWNINIAKMSLSECNGKLYALWTQFNDVPNGITDDCASWSSSQYSGSANGELFVSISSDNGTLWDIPRNLTNSYTPNCDPSIGYDCESDNWASMARYGRQNQAGDDWSGAVVVDPSGSYSGDYFLDFQYVHDRDAGGIIQGEGSWQLSNINWFRLTCVDPIYSPGPIILTPNNIDLPTWVKPNVELTIDLTIENLGNADVSYNISVEEDNGPAGWLAVSGFSGTVLSGLSNIEIGTLHLNTAGVQTSEAGLYGRVIFNSNSVSSPDTIPVYLAVVDTLVTPSIDSILGYMSLVVSNNGNYGNMGNNGTGRLNFDYTANSLDCDTTADIYLYDASPLLGKIEGVDTIFYHSFRQDNWLNPNSFRPIGGQALGNGTKYNWYSTGILTTPDTTIALEQTFYAPTTIGANYMIKKLKIWSADGAAHNGLRIGDVVDWDIPSDTNAWNSSAFDPTRNLIYQIGGEFDQDNPQGDDCIDSDRRFGGMAFLKSVLNGTEYKTITYSTYTAPNNQFIEPTGNLVSGELWNNMGQPGFSVETGVYDQHTVICYEPSFDLGATDTIVFWTSLLSVYDGTVSDILVAADSAFELASCLNTFPSDCNPVGSCCVANRGNVDGDALDEIDISDLVALVAYMFQGSATPVCLEEADIDGSGGIDISDLVTLVAFMFQGGAAPAACP